MTTTFTGARVFDGGAFLTEACLTVADGRVITGNFGAVVQLDGGYILPGLVDLQVNGGGGQMVNGQTTADDLRRLCDVHARLGTTSILPTLITDTPDATATVLAAGIKAAAQGVPGFLGLHLEGPHLDPRRKGAHDAALIRSMTDDDLNRLCDGAKHLPSLLVTLAPESVTPDQITALSRAGVIVSLGHSDCSLATAQSAFQAGASCVTHLFNAMSQLGNREPGLVGAALTHPVHAGLIADGIHVAPEAMRIAMAAQPEQIFLVSDAMAISGTNTAKFTLAGRQILRQQGRLTLEDGTLAGADLTLPQAIQVMVQKVGTPIETAFAMATTRPAACIKRGDVGSLRPGAVADFVHLDSDLALRGVWRGGQKIL